MAFHWGFQVSPHGRESVFTQFQCFTKTGVSSLQEQGKALTHTGKVDSCHFTDALKKFLVRSYLGSEGIFLSFTRYLTDVNLSQDEKKKSHSFKKKKLQFYKAAPNLCPLPLQ